MSTATRKQGNVGQQADSWAQRKGTAHQTTPAAAARDVTPERIQARAYEIYLARTAGGTPGDATSDWLQAERELSGAAPQPSEAEIEIKARARGEALLASGK